jgi:hypothetical protein
VVPVSRGTRVPWYPCPVVPMPHTMPMRPMDPWDHGSAMGPCEIRPVGHGTRDEPCQQFDTWIHAHGYGSMSLALFTFLVETEETELKLSAGLAGLVIYSSGLSSILIESGEPNRSLLLAG